MRIFIGYIYTTRDGKISPGLEIVKTEDTELLSRCFPYLYSGEPVPHNEPEFAEIVEEVPIEMRKDGIYIQEMLAR